MLELKAVFYGRIQYDGADTTNTACYNGVDALPPLSLTTGLIRRGLGEYYSVAMDIYYLDLANLLQHKCSVLLCLVILELVLNTEWCW